MTSGFFITSFDMNQSDEPEPFRSRITPVSLHGLPVVDPKPGLATGSYDINNRKKTLPAFNPHSLDIQLGNEHINIQRRYEALGALNDLLIAIGFLVGSIMFLTSSLQENGTWLFIVGSVQLLIKPTIKLISLVHVQRVYNRGRPPAT